MSNINVFDYLDGFRDYIDAGFTYDELDMVDSLDLEETFPPHVIVEYKENESLDKILDSYMGSFESPEDFAMETFIECNTTRGIDDLIPYLDSEKVTRDIMMNYTEINGYFFQD